MRTGEATATAGSETQRGEGRSEPETSDGAWSRSLSDRAGEALVEVSAEVVAEDGGDGPGGRADRGQREGEPPEDGEYEAVEEEADARGRGAGGEQFEVPASTEDPEEEPRGEDTEEAGDAAHERDDPRGEEPAQREEEREDEQPWREGAPDPASESRESPAAPSGVGPLAPAVRVVEVIVDDLAVEVSDDLAVVVPEAVVRPAHTHPWSRRYIGLSRPRGLTRGRPVWGP